LSDASLFYSNTDTDQYLISKRATNGFNKSGWNVFQTGSDELLGKRWKSGAKRKREIEPQGKRNRTDMQGGVYGTQIIGAQ
jgi:hypothetical protein